MVKRTANIIDRQSKFLRYFIVQENIIKIATGKRSIIRLNDITASKKKYKRYGSLMLKNFVSSKITSIAIFANEYVPDNIDLRSSIKYILTIIHFIFIIEIFIISSFLGNEKAQYKIYILIHNELNEQIISSKSFKAKVRVTLV